MSEAMEFPATKRCIKCGEGKALAEFYKNAATRDGLTNKCKGCSDAYSKVYATKNRKAISAYLKQYLQDRRDGIRAVNQAGREKLRNEKREQKDRKSKEIEQLRKDKREEKQREKAANAQRRKEKQKERVLKWKRNHKSRVNETNRRWRQENPEKMKGYYAGYRARQKAMREFFKMHRAMHAIAETLNQMKP